MCDLGVALVFEDRLVLEQLYSGYLMAAWWCCGLDSLSTKESLFAQVRTSLIIYGVNKTSLTEKRDLQESGCLEGTILEVRR
jgi:hypothetical protein